MIRLLTCLFLILLIVGCKEEEEREKSSSLPSTSKYAFQRERWNKAILNKADLLRLDKEITRYNQSKNRYIKIEKMRSNGVPAIVVSGLHYRESSGDFTKHLHEGSPLSGRTRDVPKGRIPNKNPPYTFEESSEDALYVIKSMDKVNWSDVSSTLQAIEKFNGLGYQKMGKISAYVWSGCSIYKGGKYIRDHVYSDSAVDKQLGVAAIMKRAQERGVKLSFESKGNRNLWDDIKDFFVNLGWW